MAEFLNYTIINSLRTLINSSTIFCNNDHYNYAEYNLICAVMDRTDTCVKFLNNHSNCPSTEENLIVFLMYSSMLVDSVKETFRQLKIPYPYSHDSIKAISFESNPEHFTYFRDNCLQSKLNIDEINCPTDDKFFEYFRSLSFAHPVNTNRPKFLRDKETQYSPFVISNNPMMRLGRELSFVGVRIYNNLDEDIIDFTFPFINLKKYICSRYELFNLIINVLKKRIEIQEDDWKKRKVKRDKNDIETLKDIQTILRERHEEDIVDEAISCLSSKFTLQSNEKAVQKLRQQLSSRIPELCKCIDELNYDEANRLIDIMHVHPRIVYQGFGYQMEKIFSYLRDDAGDNNNKWGRIQADLFSKEFAKKWVVINAFEMSFEEIKLLVRTACYLEWKEQGE